MESDQEPHEIAADLSRKPHRILMAIRNRGGEAKTSVITEDTDIDGSQVNYHYKGLMRANLIERVDEDTNDDPIPREGYTYRITDRGKKVLSAAQEDYGMTPLEEGVVRRRLDELDGRLGAVEEALQEDIATDGTDVDLEERMNELEEFVEGLREDMEKVVDMVRDLEDGIEDTDG